MIYKNEDKILRVRSDRDLKKFKKKSPKIYTAIHEVANCYHYIGFLIKSDLLTNKRAIYQEGGDTILGIHRIIKGVIARDREFAQKNTYKQYLDFIVEDIEKFKQMDALAGKRWQDFRKNSTGEEKQYGYCGGSNQTWYLWERSLRWNYLSSMNFEPLTCRRGVLRIDLVGKILVGGLPESGDASMAKSLIRKASSIGEKLARGSSG